LGLEEPKEESEDSGAGGGVCAYECIGTKMHSRVTLRPCEVLGEGLESLERRLFLPASPANPAVNWDLSS